MGKMRRKNIKEIQKEIERLKKEFQKVELRPCHSDAELKEKYEDIKLLKNMIFQLEKEANEFALYISGRGK